MKQLYQLQYTLFQCAIKFILPIQGKFVTLQPQTGRNPFAERQRIFALFRQLWIDGDDYGEWSISKDNLTIEVGDIIGDFEIDELNSDELSISGEWSEIDTRTGEVREIFKSSYNFKKK